MLGRFFRWKSRAAAPTIADAIAHHEAGRLAQAEAIYQRLLENEPQHVDALHFLGMLALQQGDAARAGELIERSLEIHPANVAARFNLAHMTQLQARP